MSITAERAAEIAEVIKQASELLKQLTKEPNLEQEYIEKYERNIEKIILDDNLHLLKYISKTHTNDLLEQHRRHNLIHIAAQYGHLEILTYLHKQHNLNSNYSTLLTAAYKGHLEIVKYLHKQMGICDGNNIIDHIIIPNGSLEMIQYLCEEMELPYTITGIHSAIIINNLPVLIYLHVKNKNILRDNSKKAVYFAVLNNSVDCLKYLHEHLSLPFTLEHVKHAADNKNLELIRYMIDRMKS